MKEVLRGVAEGLLLCSLEEQFGVIIFITVFCHFTKGERGHESNKIINQEYTKTLTTFVMMRHSLSLFLLMT
jgi:hypothetical protein